MLCTTYRQSLLHWGLHQTLTVTSKPPVGPWLLRSAAQCHATCRASEHARWHLVRTAMLLPLQEWQHVRPVVPAQPSETMAA